MRNERGLQNPKMNILLIAIILSLGIFGGLGASITAYAGFLLAAMVIGIIVFIGSITVLIILLSTGSWKR